MILNPARAWVRQVAALAVLLLLWEAAARAGMLNPLYMPSPGRIAAALIELFASGRIWPHLEATFAAALAGLVLGIAVGIVLGVVAALVPLIAELLQPVMMLLNAIPRVILAPLFVIWLGIGLASKVALAFILVAGTRPAVPLTLVAASACKAPSASAAARVPPPEKLMITADLSIVLGAFWSSIV